MTENDQHLHVCLADFRRNNGLLQQDIADYLNVSRGYVSLVENGTSKLSKNKIDKLYESRELKHWDTSSLIPAFYRLNALAKKITLDDIPGIERVKYGETGITDVMADYIMAKVPEVNKEWLIDGKGMMFWDEGGDVSASTRHTSIKDLQRRIAKIQKELNLLSSQLKEMGPNIEEADEPALDV